ncbi:enoyl-CoA hydratase/isomerase family protein [Ramlibacter sp.]|uniref:enoyl-CoA hydratase/isomerase family protein n=1 Tax=Ramlibacter sp. TaxID=1917967 RepID=UPI003D0D24E8
MNDEWVLVERRGAAGVITINRPDVHNAWGREQLLRVEKALDEFAVDPEVRAVILTGAGEKAFIAGGDIGDLESRRGIDHYNDMAEIIQRVFRRFETYDKVTIAAVNGLALGGGVEIMLCMDIRILGDHVRLGLPEINLGMMPGAGGTQRLLRQIPLCKAKELMFTGEWINAQEAVTLGIANRVVPKASVMDEALAFAEKMATKSPLALKLMKRAVLNGGDMSLSAGLAYEHSLIGLVFESEDMHEGCRAFLEKRPAQFKGR